MQSDRSLKDRKIFDLILRSYWPSPYTSTRGHTMKLTGEEFKMDKSISSHRSQLIYLIHYHKTMGTSLTSFELEIRQNRGGQTYEQILVVIAKDQGLARWATLGILDL